MLLTDSNEVPVGDEWLYETKYDGFRCMLIWEKGEHTPILRSRNNNTLNPMFPEIIRFCEEYYNDIEPYLPLMLDGELVYLTNDFQSDFSIVQRRGRMKNASNIETHAESFPCHYIVFDVLTLEGKFKVNSRLSTRKQLLATFFEKLSLPTHVDYKDAKRLQAIDVFEDSASLWQKVKASNGEGIIAKKVTSKWIEATRSKSWLKIKNWKFVNVIITKFDKSNGFFDAAVFNDDTLIEVVTFKHGLKEEEKELNLTKEEAFEVVEKYGYYDAVFVQEVMLDILGQGEELVYEFKLADDELQFRYGITARTGYIFHENLGIGPQPDSNIWDNAIQNESSKK